jgi:hypothetical protein
MLKPGVDIHYVRQVCRLVLHELLNPHRRILIRRRPVAELAELVVAPGVDFAAVLRPLNVNDEVPSWGLFAGAHAFAASLDAGRHCGAPGFEQAPASARRAGIDKPHRANVPGPQAGGAMPGGLLEAPVYIGRVEGLFDLEACVLQVGSRVGVELLVLGLDKRVDLCVS